MSEADLEALCPSSRNEAHAEILREAAVIATAAEDLEPGSSKAQIARHIDHISRKVAENDQWRLRQLLQRSELAREHLVIVDGQVHGVETSSGHIAATQCVLAIGHSARDTYQLLYDAGFPLRAKAFQLGLRIEQPQEIVNQQKYGRDEYLQQLGAADYSLVAKGERDLFTFCMCAGGIM